MTTTTLTAAAKIQLFIDASTSVYGKADIPLTAKEVIALRDVANTTIPGVIWKNPTKTFGLNKFILPEILKIAESAPAKSPKQRKAAKTEPMGLVAAAPALELVADTASATVTPIAAAPVLLMPTLADNDNHDRTKYIPEIRKTYVPWGNTDRITTILKSGFFFPTLITGPTGNGKTEMVEQAAAQLRLPLIRVNVTIETDESKLIGGMFLVDGNTVWKDGPVITAMKTGSIVLLDEVDLAGDKILCLQSIMEGKPYYNKKTGETIVSAAGFSIVCTANTKGAGDSSGRYVGARMLNAAFLDRINITLEQPYAPAAQELKILKLYAGELLGNEKPNTSDVYLMKALTIWADSIRTAMDAGTVNEGVSTRRLCSILKTYYVFGADESAVDFAITGGTARFEEDERDAFASLWRAAFNTREFLGLPEEVAVEEGDMNNNDEPRDEVPF